MPGPCWFWIQAQHCEASTRGEATASIVRCTNPIGEPARALRAVTGPSVGILDVRPLAYAGNSLAQGQGCTRQQPPMTAFMFLHGTYTLKTPEYERLFEKEVLTLLGHHYFTHKMLCARQTPWGTSFG